MYLLDTNVVSETRRIASGKADGAVTAWMAQIDPATAFLSAMTLFELERGIRLVERRDTRQGAALRRWLDGTVKVEFAGRIHALTDEVAVRCAAMHIPDPRSERDAWIAATALVHGLTVVTRNVADFVGMHVPIVNPWDEPSGP
jgi:predicted nucleic acid-binding protein